MLENQSVKPKISKFKFVKHWNMSDILCLYAFYNFMLKISKCKIHQTIQYVRMCPCVHVSMIRHDSP